MLRVVTLFGSLLLAMIGGGILYLAVAGFLADRPQEEEPAPTPLSLAEFERDGKIPEQSWLEVSDGVLLWSEASVEVRLWKLQDQKTKIARDQAVFVPLVSKQAFDVGQKWKDDLKQPIQVARVYVRFEPAAASAEAPRVETAVDQRTKVRGIAVRLDKEPAFLREGLAPKGSLKDPAKLLVIRYNEDPSSKNAVLFAHICMGSAGLVFLLPLFVWITWMVGRRRAA